MKQVRKKLVSVTMIGLSAWLLVIGLVLFDSSTKAMLTGELVPSAETSNVLGAETNMPSNTPQAATSRPHISDASETLITGITVIALGTVITIAVNISQHKKRTSTHPSK